MLRQAKLHVPPGKRGQEQMSKDEVEKTKSIANRRIYVEQAIARMKTFRIIKGELPISLAPHADNILRICAAICNLMGPIAKGM